MWKLLPPEPAVVPMLSARQEEAAKARPGVTLVIGGPGSGKTTTLVESVVRRVQEGAQLSSIAVLAGSRAAAQGLRREVIGRLGRAHATPVFTTLHGLALGMMRQYQPDDEEPWVLLRAPQQEQRIRELLVGGEDRWPEDIRPALVTRAFARQVREFLARVRQRSWDEQDLAELAAERGEPVLAALAAFFAEYLAVGDLERTLDYAELIYRARLLTTETGVAQSLQSQFTAVLVDDAHDLDLAQAALLGDLAALGIPVTVFGDPQQAVSGFRGADATGMAELLRHEPSTRIELAQTHRHSQAVAEALAALRAKLPAQHAPEPPETPARLDGEATVRIFDDATAEAEHVADELRRAVADGAAWADLAVIMRAGRAQLAPMARELQRLGIPVEIAADELVLAEEESVVTLLLALKVAADGAVPTPLESDALLRSPLGGLDAIGLRRLGRILAKHSPEDTNSVALVGNCLAHPELLSMDTPESNAARRLAERLASAAKRLETGAEIQQVLWDFWSATDWPEHLRQAALGGSSTAHQQLDAVVELFERAAREPVRAGRSGAHTFIRELAGEEIPADTGRELTVSGVGVHLTTAHRAKGREWDRVWIPGVQEGRWPRVMPGALLLDPGHLLDGTPRTVNEQLQEERRLLHLACARAKTHLHVSGSLGTDEDAAPPSRFLEDLGVEPELISGRPARPLTPGELVGSLRAGAADAEEPEVLRRGAAQRLALLAVQDVAAAKPANWWGKEPMSPTPDTGKEYRFSGSSLDELLRCPRKYFLSRKAKAQEPRNVRASVGEIIHLVAQHAQRDGLTVDEMKAELDAIWERIPFEASWMSSVERANTHEVLERLANWITEYRDELLGVEQAFKTTLDVAGYRVVLQGFADRIDLLGRGTDDERLRVVDFKTSAKKSPAKVAEDIQLGVYQLAAREGAFEALAPGIRNVAPPALLYLREAKGTMPAVVEQSVLEPGRTWVHDKIIEGMEIINSGEFPAVENEFCEHCPFKPGCPLFAEEAL